MTQTTRARAGERRVRLTHDQIRHGTERRPGLFALGLIEEEKPIDGYGFTYWKHPADAVNFYKETHGGAEARRFYCAEQMYVLAE